MASGWGRVSSRGKRLFTQYNEHEMCEHEGGWEVTGTEGGREFTLVKTNQDTAVTAKGQPDWGTMFATSNQQRVSVQNTQAHMQ